VDLAPLTDLKRRLHEHWDLGRNIVLTWAFDTSRVIVLTLPHYALGQAGRSTGSALTHQATDVGIQRILAMPRPVAIDELAAMAAALRRDPIAVDFHPRSVSQIGQEAIEDVVRPYSLLYTSDRAVALFDIVGFARHAPLEQVAQLSSLGYSINQAHSKMLSKDVDVNFARSTTGDGFYLWNRDPSVQSNAALYHFMHLVLADNAIARSHGSNDCVPLLRACFHIGGYYEFYNSYRLWPTNHSYIVGPVTVELARLAEKARPGQVLLGDFRTTLSDDECGSCSVELTTEDFIVRAQRSLDRLNGITLSGGSIEAIKCYLTGDRDAGGGFNVKKYLITDKHGFSRTAFNAKINIYRRGSGPIYLGAQNSELDAFEQVLDVMPARHS
jgi:hypothetical protein